MRYPAACAGDEVPSTEATSATTRPSAARIRRAIQCRVVEVVVEQAAGRVPDKAWKRAYWERTKDATCEAARTGYPDVARTDRARAAYLKAIAEENCARGHVYGAGDAATSSLRGAPE